MPGGRWHAPPVSGPDPQRRAYLRTGASESRVALGPMADIVHDSTSWLSDADLDAVLVHLAGQPAATPRPAPAPGSAQATAPGPETQARDEPGAALYERHCADCHGRDGRGRAGAYPPLAGNPTVLADPPINLVRIVLDGGFAPSTPANPRPFGMPPFAQVLERRALADVLGFVRRAWGNRAPPVDARTIERQLAGGQD